MTDLSVADSTNRLVFRDGDAVSDMPETIEPIPALGHLLTAHGRVDAYDALYVLHATGIHVFLTPAPHDFKHETKTLVLWGETTPRTALFMVVAKTAMTEADLIEHGFTSEMDYECRVCGGEADIAKKLWLACEASQRGADADAGFDGGEWSAAAHARALLRKGQEIVDQHYGRRGVQLAEVLNNISAAAADNGRHAWLSETPLALLLF